MHNDLIPSSDPNFSWDLKKDYKPKDIIFVNLLCDYNYGIERAYREAYKLKPHQSSKNAWRLWKKDKIQDLLRQRREELMVNLNINFQTQIAKLEDIRQLAMSKGDLKNAMQAIQLINKMLGWDIKILKVDETKNDSVNIEIIMPHTNIEDQKTIELKDDTTSSDSEASGIN